jgi:hypothetical protein
MTVLVTLFLTPDSTRAVALSGARRSLASPAHLLLRVAMVTEMSTTMKLNIAPAKSIGTSEFISVPFLKAPLSILAKERC